MYIRRKVFSYGYDENGEEKLFSTTEIMSEESYIERLYSEGEPGQKQFASVRGMKKLGKRLTDAAIDMNRKELGRVAATANRQGLNKNSFKLIDNKNFDKVAKSRINNLRKRGIDIPKAETAEVIKGGKEIAKQNAAEAIKRGGKALKW